MGGWQVEQMPAGLEVRLVGADATQAERVANSLDSMFAAENVLAPVLNVVIVAELARGASGKAPLIVARRPTK